MYHFQCLCVLLLSMWIGYIDALEPSCLRLSGSQECQAFQDYAVDVLNAVPWIQNSTSVEDVDEHLRSYVEQQQWWRQGNNSNSNSNSSSGNPLCGSSSEIFSPRYSKTVLCAQIVRTSPGCNTFNSTSLLPSLCNTTCAGFVNSITSCYLANATILDQQCPSDSDDTTCVNGYDNEKLCGWVDDGYRCTYCQAKPNDPCCATLHEYGNCSSFNTRQLVGVVLGSVFGSLLLLGCIWYYCWWDHRYKHYSPPWPFSNSPFSTKKFGFLTHHQHTNNGNLTRYSPYNDNTIGSSNSSNNLIPRQIPTNNDKSETDRMVGKGTTVNMNEMDHMNNTLSMHNPVGTITTTNYDDESSIQLSYTLAEQHATGYCFYQAIYVNVPSRPDDIVLERGDIVYLHCYTNEDWGIGYNISTGQQGSFPMICICSISLNQVWEWVSAHSMVKQRILLKHRVSYFISSTQHENEDNENEDAEADDEHDMTAAETTTKKAVVKMKTKRAGTATTATTMMMKMTLSPSSDDEDSPLTPPPPTLLHRALGKKNKGLGRSKRWTSGSSHQQQQLYYQPLDSTLTLGYPPPLD